MRANHGLVPRMHKISNTIDRCTIKVTAVFTMFDKLSSCYIYFHLFTWVEEVIFSMDLTGPTWPRCICEANNLVDCRIFDIQSYPNPEALINAQWFDILNSSSFYHSGLKSKICPNFIKIYQISEFYPTCPTVIKWGKITDFEPLCNLQSYEVIKTSQITMIWRLFLF